MRRRHTPHFFSDSSDDFDDVDALELKAELLLADLRNVVGEMSTLLAPEDDDNT